MHRTPILLLAVALTAGAASAQTASPAPVAQPSTPAPTIENAPAPAVVQVQNSTAPATTSAPTSVTQIVYSPQLPSIADLTSAASAQGLTVERIVQTAGQVIVFYRNASGQASTVAYQSLPPSGTAPATAAAVTTTATVATPATTAPRVVVVSQPQTVVYETAPRVVYYDDYPRYYYPRYYYPPVSLSFGFGYRSYHGGGHHHHFRR